MRARTLLLIAILITGCNSALDDLPPDYNVYQVVLTDLAYKTQMQQLDGDKVLVGPEFLKGESLDFYSMGDKITVDADLLVAIKKANDTPHEFPEADFLIPQSKVGKVEKTPEGRTRFKKDEERDAKCIVQFWRAGISDDGQRAVVRFYYSPSPHGVTGTYLLKRTETGWPITGSMMNYYV